MGGGGRIVYNTTVLTREPQIEMPKFRWVAEIEIRSGFGVIEISVALQTIGESSEQLYPKTLPHSDFAVKLFLFFE